MLWAGVVLAVLVAAGLWYWQAGNAANAAPSYSTEPAVRGNLTLTVTANGTLQPTRSISIGSELSGTVLKVNADVNDRIKKGQVLVELDTAKLGDQILRFARRAGLPPMPRWRRRWPRSRRPVPVWPVLKRSRACPVERYRQSPNSTVPVRSVERANADEASARASVKDAQAALSTDGINLSKASIRAPRRWDCAHSHGGPGQCGRSLIAISHAVHGGRRPHQTQALGLC